VKTTFLDIKEIISSQIDNHINQAKKIEELKSKIRELEPKASLFVESASKLNHLLKETKIKVKNSELHRVMALSYKTVYSSDKVWLDFPDFNSSKRYGLIYKGYAVGIVVEDQKRALAVYHSSPNSIYSVLIGKDRVEGVAFGHKDELFIKYIPKYKNPKVGDEVVTSGFDNIFYEGIKVGKVVDIYENPLYKIAVVKPYIKLDNPRFLYAVEVK
jgi:rod shape-determining protein MreC